MEVKEDALVSMRAVWVGERLRSMFSAQLRRAPLNQGGMDDIGREVSITC